MSLLMLEPHPGGVKLVLAVVVKVGSVRLRALRVPPALTDEGPLSRRARGTNGP